MYDARLIERADNGRTAWEITRRGRPVMELRYAEAFEGDQTRESYERFASAPYGRDLVAILSRSNMRGLVKLGARTVSLVGAILARFAKATMSPTEDEVAVVLNLAQQAGLTDKNYRGTETREKLDAYIANLRTAEEGKDDVEKALRDLRDTIINLSGLEVNVVVELVKDKQVQERVDFLYELDIEGQTTDADTYLRAIRDVYPELFDAPAPEAKHTVGSPVEFDGTRRVVEMVYRRAGRYQYKLSGLSKRVAEDTIFDPSIPVLVKPNWLNPALETQWFVAYEKAKVNGSVDFGTIMQDVETYAEAKGLPVRVDQGS